MRVFAEPESDRCPVRIIDTYLSKLPENPPAFYLQWLPRVPADAAQPWYKRVQVGINPLKKMMPTISERANLPIRYTNHSLRATAATRMFASGVPEKVIGEVTGHKSLNAFRTYEHTSEDQQRAAGLAISNLSIFRTVETKEEETSIENVLPKVSQLPQISGTLSNCTFNFNF